MQYQFDMLGEQGLLCGWEHVEYRAFEDAPEEFNLTDWLTNLVLGAVVGIIFMGLVIVTMGGRCILTGFLIGAATGGVVPGGHLIGIGLGGAVEGAVERTLRGEKITFSNIWNRFHGISVDSRDIG